MHTVYEQQECTIRVVRVIPLIRFVVTYCIGHQRIPPPLPFHDDSTQLFAGWVHLGHWDGKP